MATMTSRAVGIIWLRYAGRCGHVYPDSLGRHCKRMTRALVLLPTQRYGLRCFTHRHPKGGDKARGS